MLLVLKIVLVPVLIALVTLGARRWGPRVGGWLSGLPTVAGPTLCFFAFEQGNAFAARAAHATLVGLIAVPFFCLAYVYTGRYWNWVVSLLAGWLAFGVGVMMLIWLDPGVAAAWVLLAASCALGYVALPAHAVFAEPTAHSGWDLPMRMVAAATLVFVLTSMAERLGPALTGLFTPFPVATAIIAAFTHTQRGVDPVIAFFRGFLPALVSFGLFCLVLAVGLEPLGLAVALPLALAVQLSTQSVTLWRTTRHSATAQALSR